MGNWRRAHIIGTCDESDLAKLREYLYIDLDTLGSLLDTPEQQAIDDDIGNRFGPLSITKSGSICGLDNWLAVKMDIRGNLAERDYSPQDVCNQLNECLKYAPSLHVKVHLGDDWESETCIATVKRLGDSYFVAKPAITTVDSLTESEIDIKFADAINGATAW